MRTLALSAIVSILCCVLATEADAQLFIRGDANATNSTNLADSVFVASYLFSDGPPPPASIDASDTNDNGVTEVADIVYILTFVFLGGPVPPAPFPLPGEDPTPDDFDPPVDPDFELTLDTLTTIEGAIGLELDLRIDNAVPLEAIEVALGFDTATLFAEQ